MNAISFTEFLNNLERSGNHLVVQTLIGRSGSLLLTSLFDSHPEVLMFPGASDFYSGIYPRASAPGGSWQEEVRSALHAWQTTPHLNACRHLGPNRDQFFFYDPDFVVATMEKALAGGPASRKRLFLAYLYAIGVFLKRDLSKIRHLWAHEHTDVPTDDFIKTILEDFPEARFVCTVRHPATNYTSLLKMRKVIGELGLHDWQYNFSMAGKGWWAYRDFLRCYEPYGSRFLFVRLEDMQRSKATYIKALAANLGISDSPTLSQSTFAGLLWWGDIFAAPEAGFRNARKATIPRWLEAAMVWLLSPEMKTIGYETPSSPYRWLSLLLFPLWRWDDVRPLFDLGYYRHLRSQRLSVLGTVLREVSSIARSYWSLAKQILIRRNYPGLQGRVFSPPTPIAERRAA